MTRGALTTFSLANDVAKYFAILPALMMSTIPEMTSLYYAFIVTKSAIISALIFNALIIVALIPLP